MTQQVAEVLISGAIAAALVGLFGGLILGIAIALEMKQGKIVGAAAWTVMGGVLAIFVLVMKGIEAGMLEGESRFAVVAITLLEVALIVGIAVVIIRFLRGIISRNIT